MLEGPFALALAAGMAATVNPCGFALLPAYLVVVVVVVGAALHVGTFGLSHPALTRSHWVHA